MKLYINYYFLIKCLRNENIIDRLMKQRIILLKFDLNIYYVCDRELIIANDFLVSRNIRLFQLTNSKILCKIL